MGFPRKTIKFAEAVNLATAREKGKIALESMRGARFFAWQMVASPVKVVGSKERVMAKLKRGMESLERMEVS